MKPVRQEANAALRFRQLRLTMRLTQQEAADLFKVAVKTWQEWEYGQTPFGPALVLLGVLEAMFDLGDPE